MGEGDDPQSELRRGNGCCFLRIELVYKLVEAFAHTLQDLIKTSHIRQSNEAHPRLLSKSVVDGCKIHVLVVLLIYIR